MTQTASGEHKPEIAVGADGLAALSGSARDAFEQILPTYLLSRRWFGGKARRIKEVHLHDMVPLTVAGVDGSALALIEVTYGDDAEDMYLLPLAYATADHAAHLERDEAGAVIAWASEHDGRRGAIYDALVEPRITTALLDAIGAGHTFDGEHGSLLASTTPAWTRLRGDGHLAARLIRAEQSNTSIVFGDRLILKLFRHLEPGLNPDLEIGRFLTEQVDFANIPPVGGALEYRVPNGALISVAILQGFVANQGDAWQYTLEALQGFYDRVAGLPAPQVDTTTPLLQRAEQDIGAEATQLLGDYAEAAQLLGRRTGELHLALATDTNEPDFTSEPFSLPYQRTIYDGLLALSTRIFALLGETFERLPAAATADARWLLDHQGDVARAAQPLLEHQVDALRLRYHGDYHLGQVLWTGDDFFLIDFEGEPARSLDERRTKRSPLQDVAGMIRSFHYASYAALLGQGANPAVSDDEFARLEPWAQAWYGWISTLFLHSYLQTIGNTPFVPTDRADLQMLLDVYMLDKAIYELGYELNNRPTWVKIPMQGIRQLLAGV